MQHSKEMGSGTIDVSSPISGVGKLTWKANALLSLGGLHNSGWHLDGVVEIGRRKVEFDNAMMDGRMSVEMINLLMEKDPEAQSYIVETAANATGLEIRRLRLPGENDEDIDFGKPMEIDDKDASEEKAEDEKPMPTNTIAAMGCPPADELAPGDGVCGGHSRIEESVAFRWGRIISLLHRGIPMAYG